MSQTQIVNPSHATSSLDDLAARVRVAHAGLVSAFSNAIGYAIEAGQALNAAKSSKEIRHGQWTKFLKHCEIGERQAQRYMHLAHLVAANPSSRTDLAGLSIQDAIKKLSPPKRQSDDAPLKKDRPRTEKPNDPRPASHIDILESWVRASSAEQKRAVDSIGFRNWLDAIPAEWLPQLEQWLAGRDSSIAVRAPEQASDSDGLSIPEFLQRASSPAAHAAAFVDQHEGGSDLECTPIKITDKPIKNINDVEMLLRNWRRRPVCELPDLALAIRRAAGRGLHLEEKHWRAIDRIESVAREKAAAV